MKVLISEKLSAHKVKTPEGYLICSDAILARTGKQTYTRNELFQDGDNSEIEVDRTPEEVFSEETLASFENKPLTITHPDEDVTPDNYRELGVGFVRDVRRATRDGQEVMIANIIVTDSEAIEAIESGELLELSCGYDCDISDDEHPCQKNIRGNHVALCKQGRAGNARIIDSKVNDTVLEVGKTYGARSGAKLTIRGLKCGISDYNGEAYIEIKYDWVSASGKKKGSSTCYEKDFFRMMTDKSLTGDSVKDAKYVILHPQKNMYLSVGGKSWVEESNVMIKTFSSEAEAEAYGKKYCNTCRIIKLNDMINDAMFEIWYIDKGDVHITLSAKSEDDARKKFWHQYGAYYIKSIKKIRDVDTQEEVTKGMKKNLKNFKDAKYRVGQKVMYNGKQTVIVKIEHDNKYGYDLLIKNPNWDGNNPKLENVWVGENVKTIDCEDCEDSCMKDAKIYVGYQYSVKKGDFADWAKEARRVGLQAEESYGFGGGGVELTGSEQKIRQFLKERDYSDDDISLGFKRGRIIDEQRVADSRSVYNSLGMQIDEAQDSDELDDVEYAITTAKRDGNLTSSEYSDLMRDLKQMRKSLGDSVKDAMQNFEITWIDTYTKSKGYSKDMWRFVAKIKANTLKEALQKLADKVALGGVGTANAFVVSIHSDKASYQYSGKLSDLLRKNLGDSKKEFIVKVNGKKYKTMAKDSFEAVQNIEKVLAIIKK